MFHLLNKKYVNVLLTLLVLSPMTTYAFDIENDVPVLESEEALARSEAARQEAIDAQRQMEEEQLNSVSVINQAKAAIDQARRDEKRATQSRLATEKFVAKMKKQKADLEAKRKLGVARAKKSEAELNRAEKQRDSLKTATEELRSKNDLLNQQIRELSKKEKQLQAEIRGLKLKQKTQLKVRKTLQGSLAKSKARVQSLNSSKLSLQ